MTVLRRLSCVRQAALLYPPTRLVPAWEAPGGDPIIDFEKEMIVLQL